MLVWLTFLLIVLAWAAWLFNGLFEGKKRILIYVSLLFVSSLATLSWYYYLGAHQELKKTAQLHEQLAGLSLEVLANKADAKEITIQQLLAELRLRAEVEPDNFDQWKELGNIFLRFNEVGKAEQAFIRAITAKPEASSRMEFAQYFIEQGSPEALDNAERHINLVLMKEPDHEGALLLQGINYFKQKQYPAAIRNWQKLLQSRDKGSDSYRLIKQQIAQAERQLKLAQLNHITVVIDNVDSLLLTRYKKAFVLVRSQSGGPPIAVRSYDVSTLDKPLKISPDNVMLPGVDLWKANGIYIEVRLSQSGFAKPESGDKFGRTALKESLTPSENFHIEITQIVE